MQTAARRLANGREKDPAHPAGHHRALFCRHYLFPIFRGPFLKILGLLLLCCSLKNLADADSELVRRAFAADGGWPGSGAAGKRMGDSRSGKRQVTANSPERTNFVTSYFADLSLSVTQYSGFAKVTCPIVPRLARVSVAG